MIVNSLKFKNDIYKISLTAYRAVKLLNMLLEKPRGKEEIIESFRNDKVTEYSANKDTLRITVNSLRAVGCKIRRPTVKNGYCYVLEDCSFKISLSKKQLTVLNILRNNILKQNDWKTVIKLNNFYEKISDIIEDSELKDVLKYKKPFAKIRPEILEALQSGDILKKEVIINYASTSKKNNKINIYPDKIFCDAGKLYIWAWYFKRKSYSYFNAEKILSVADIKKSDFVIPKENYTAIYELYGDSIKNFRCEPEEKITFKSDERLVISYEVVNEFKFFQRLLAFGNDFRLTEPKYALMRLNEKINSIIERYKNETP